ncbi:MAG: DUF2889 domain-containing protein [Azospirillaceae bacterium]
MPLSPPAEREPIHTRTVTCRGYRRQDGLWDIEGHITDVKAYAFDNQYRGRVVPGDPIHEMWIRLTVDDTLTIRAVEAATDKSPYAMCGAITPAYEALVGLIIRPGFTRLVRQRLGGAKGCTHITELIGPVATTAFQTVYPVLARERGEGGAATGTREESTGRRPPLLNSCHAFAATSPVVKHIWPEHYEPPTGEG